MISNESNNFNRPLLTFEGLPGMINSIPNIPLNVSFNHLDDWSSPQREILNALEKVKLSSPS